MNTWYVNDKNNTTYYIYNGGKVLRRDMKKIKNVFIGGHVSKIEHQAFEWCLVETVHSNESNSLPKEIGNRAFFRCYYLRFILLPPTAQKIGTKAFLGCCKLSLQIVANPPNSWNEHLFMEFRQAYVDGRAEIDPSNDRNVNRIHCCRRPQNGSKVRSEDDGPTPRPEIRSPM